MHSSAQLGKACLAAWQRPVPQLQKAAAGTAAGERLSAPCFLQSEHLKDEAQDQVSTKDL